MVKANNDLRAYAKGNGVYLWQVADGYGVSYITLNAWLRKELDAAGKERFKAIVDGIAEKEGA
jgi:hypothetical protein